MLGVRMDPRLAVEGYNTKCKKASILRIEIKTSNINVAN